MSNYIEGTNLTTMSRRHHYVAVGFQRGFSLGGRIMLYDKQLRTKRNVGVRDAFVERGYNSFVDEDGTEVEDLELRWGEIENTTLPIVRALDTRREPSELEQLAIKQLAAVHLARSQAFRNASAANFRSNMEHVAATNESNDRLFELFVSERGREPNAGELAELTRDSMARSEERRQLRVESMIGIYNRTIEMMQPWSVQLVMPTSTAGFSFSDSPLVNTDGERTGVGEVALGDSREIFMPMRRDLAIAFSSRRIDNVQIPSQGIDRVNYATWGNAARFVAAHPHEHPSSVVPNYSDWIAR